MDVPADLRPLLSRRMVGVGLFRYQRGTLCYDELLIGIATRRGCNVGLWIRDLWVSDAAALWGGRELWQVPKRLASFEWHHDEVQVEDDDGLVATIRLRPRRLGLPWFWLPIPIIGGLPESRCFARASWHGRLGYPRFSLLHWSERFPFRLAARPFFGFGSDNFRMVVYSPGGSASCE